MLRIYSIAIGCCAEVGRIAEVVARRDAALADQQRRAMASVALGSAREVGTALEVAMAFGYVTGIDAELLARLDQIRATLFRILRR